MDRDMMDEADVPVTFLGEATQPIVYLANRTQLRTNNDKTPYKLWKVKHYKVFGSKCFIKSNDKNPRNFHSHANEGIFLSTHPKVKDTDATTKGQRDLRTTMI